MALWDKSETTTTPNPASSSPAPQPSTPVAPSQPARAAVAGKAADTRESIIASGLTIEGKLIPGLEIKAFRKDQRYQAETWLAQPRRDEQIAQTRQPGADANR